MIDTATDLAVEVHDLRKSCGELQAVRGVSLTVARGEVFCLLGPNGAGKTSVVEILQGYRIASGGAATVLGIPVGARDAARELRERIGIVLQSCKVPAYLTVAELVETFGRYHRARGPPTRCSSLSSSPTSVTSGPASSPAVSAAASTSRSRSRSSAIRS